MPAGACAAKNREAVPECPPRPSVASRVRTLRPPNTSAAPFVSCGKPRFRSHGAEEADDRSHYDSLEHLIARVDRVQTRRAAREENFREHCRRREAETRVETDECTARAGPPAGLADEPRERDGFNECRGGSERVERSRLLALAHTPTGKRHPALSECPGAVPEEPNDHCGDRGDDDRDPVHVSLLRAANRAANRLEQGHKHQLGRIPTLPRHAGRLAG